MRTKTLILLTWGLTLLGVPVSAPAQDYAPPPCSGVFADVPCPSPFADWIEELAARGVTSGCGGGDYCPSLPITRGQMSLYLTAAFDLTLYGP